MQDIHENRVRELAYQIWESEGRPIGHEFRHWQMASTLAGDQGNEKLEKAMKKSRNNIADESFNIDPSHKPDDTAKPAEAQGLGKKSKKQR